MTNDAHRLGRLLRLHQLAEEYRSHDYRVVIEPSRRDLPALLRGHRIDMLAISPREKVAVVVADAEGLRGSAEMVKLAELLGSRKRWRFEVAIVGEAPVARKPGLVKARSIPSERIDQVLAEAAELADKGHTAAAALLSSSAVEAILRELLIVQALRLRALESASLVKTAYAYGLIDRAESQLLLDLFAYRSAAAHGYEVKELGGERLSSLLDVARRLRKVTLRPAVAAAS